MDTILQDVRFAWRMLNKTPGFTVVVIITLALGIGANTAIFTVINALLIQPLPFPHAERLVTLNESSKELPGMSISYPNFQDWVAQNTVFEVLGARQPSGYTLTGSGDRPETLDGRNVTPAYLSVFGVKPEFGRLFTDADDRPDATPTVVLSHEFWARHFAADPHVIGSNVTLNGVSYTVIGILPLGWFPAANPPDVFTPLGLRANEMKLRANHPGIYAYGRLKPGVSLEQARAEMSAIAKRLEQQYPDTNLGISVQVQPYREAVVGDVRPALLMLFAAVGCVLLIACANVANLLLARATARFKEIAIRTALGARRWRLIRQLLTESILLALAGGALGLLLAAWGVDVLVKTSPDSLPFVPFIKVNPRVFIFTAGASIFTGLLFGLLPALQTSVPRLHDTLKEGGRTSAASGRHRARAGLVISEVALALVLLAGAGLLIRSFMRLQDVNPGFNPDNVFSARISLPRSRYESEAARRGFVDRLLPALQGLPGVKSAAVITPLPLSGEGWQTDYEVEGQPVVKGQEPNTDIHLVSPNYIQMMGIPLLRGRNLTEQDRALVAFDPEVKQHVPEDYGTPVALVNETFARRWWPGQDPIGKRVRAVSHGMTPEANPWVSIVGVVGDVKQYGLDIAPRTELYLSYRARPTGYMFVVVRTASSNPLDITNSVRGAVAQIDSDQAISTPQTMQQVINASVSSRRASMVLLAAFAGLALVLAAVGIYGVMSYSVTQRTHEIGIRMALGAARGDVLRMVLGQACTLAGIGLGIGVALALGLTRLMRDQLFGVGATDPATFAAIAVLLGSVAVLASALPAHRATRVDPVIALRYE